MKLTIRNFKNIWVLKPLIINTNSKIIKLAGRNGIWKTNTIDSIIYCIYWINGLKTIWKTFSFNEENDCEVEISNFSKEFPWLNIKRKSYYTTSRNINSQVFINWEKIEENEIEKYFPKAEISSYILKPNLFLSLSKNKKEEIINKIFSSDYNNITNEI